MRDYMIPRSTHLLEGLVVLLVVGHDGGSEGGKILLVVVRWRVVEDGRGIEQKTLAKFRLV